MKYYYGWKIKQDFKKVFEICNKNIEDPHSKYMLAMIYLKVRKKKN